MRHCHNGFLIDCKTSSAMNICLMLNHAGMEEKVLGLFSHTVFSHIPVLRDTGSPPPSWLDGVGMDQLAQGDLTSTSYLCFMYGMLAMVPMETLLSLVGNRVFLMDCMLPELFDLSERCSDVGSKLLAAKSICLLTQRVREHLEVRGSYEDWQSCFHGNSVALQSCLQFVFTAWEDALDAVRFVVRDIFQSVVSLHLWYLQSQGQCTQDDEFLHNLCLTILHDVSWSCKGKYGTLSVLVRHLGSARMLAWDSGIAMHVMQQMQEHTLACYASELYECLFRCHMAELDQSESSKVTWFTQWVVPVLETLCQKSNLQKKHTIEYVLPRLLKCGENTLHRIISHLTQLVNSADKQTSSETQLGALILCLRRARALGMLKKGGSSMAVALMPRQQNAIKKHTEITSTNMEGPGTLDLQTDETVEAISNETESCCNVDAFKSVSQKENAMISEIESDNSKGDCEVWYGLVTVQMLKDALVCRDEQVRLDTFALLCENQKTSEVVVMSELRLIRSFIPDNFNNQNPAFRQQFVALLKKLLLRLKESGGALYRQKNKNSETGMKSYQDFLAWLSRAMLDSLYPGASFAQRSTCLSGLGLLLDLYGPLTDIKEPSTPELFLLNDIIVECDLYTLLHCLTDSFEDNKREAARVLIALTGKPALQQLMTSNLLSQLFRIALDLSQSTRPQDSTTATYLFQVFTRQPHSMDILIQHIHNLQQSQAANSTKDPTERVENNETIRDENVTQGGELFQHALSSGKLDGSYLLLVIFMASLGEQYMVARTSLAVAAANKPLYPTLMCIRYCLDRINFSCIGSEEFPSWRKLLSHFLVLCLNISTVVSPVVCNSSPEGNVEAISGEAAGEMDGVYMTDPPMHNSDHDTDGRQARHTVDAASISRSHEMVSHMPEYLIVCCWRTIKEISLTLGQLTSSLATLDSLMEALLDPTQVILIGDYFTQLLLESKHRGAFELAYAGFVKVTEVLWRSGIPTLHQLPRAWLCSVLKDIKSGDPGSRLCATRRSAGVPFYVQALVTTEPTSTGRQCFKQTMQELLALALDESTVTLEMCIGKVHALNILRALYKDSRLKDDVAPYVADGLKVAILGFKSPLWTVRNSATLLMTAMMTRVFGVKRSKDESTLSRKNCQTGRTFFYNYPSLYQFLLDEIAMATEDITDQLHPGLFPILMVLGRLFPSAMEGTDTSLNLGAFIPFVIRCNASPVLKTREMASKALQPLVDKDHVTSVISDLLALLPCSPCDIFKQNQIHGTLLQLNQIMRTVPMLTPSIKSSVEDLIQGWWSHRMHMIISRQNSCLLTRKEALEVTSSILHFYSYQNHLQTCLMRTLFVEAVTGGNGFYDKGSPGLWAFQSTVCRLYMKHSVMNKISTSHTSHGNEDHNAKNYSNHKDVVVVFLKSSMYEVRQTALEQLLGMFGSLDGQEGDMKGCGERVLVACDDKMYAALGRMVVTESHEVCMELLFRLLTLLPVPSSSSPDMVGDQLLSCIDKIADFTGNDKVLAALLGYTGALLSALFCKGMESARARDVTRKWVDMMQGYTSCLDTDTDILFSCAQSLRCVAKHLLRHADFQLVCDVFKCTLDLLQAEDLNVRETTAGIADMTSSGALSVSVQPVAAEQMLLQCWQDEARARGRQLEFVHALLSVVCQIKTQNQVFEERLFDKGEVNSYWDEIRVLMAVSSSISQCLGQMDNNMESLSTEVSDLKQSIHDVILAFLSQSEAATVTRETLNLATILVNPQHYQKHVVSLYKTSVVCKVQTALFPGEKSLASLGQDVISNLKQAISVNALPQIVRQGCVQTAPLETPKESP
ncbi:thyroid adenoma-associated protein homolog isoform X2 [Dreissena polymorpha]|uniref:thyroid adenoma-associated protein homolog isoform X2 n=1 Tax=Dreissena polymorpha TaxID=45954 RepID=UPI002264E4A1|nr:thyroid adenoma-associated protein homolog isoform X2 [Dreissena polymorpha]XP_052228096.1 thyroid adenoma-associated protein homolog isoform X2 [Dreissena polymorpha]XP_052228100.1 thyroid adenoma-associated protein homolog isoform X2 [Dreissena polymorpha]